MRKSLQILMMAVFLFAGSVVLDSPEAAAKRRARKRRKTRRRKKRRLKKRRRRKGLYLQGRPRRRRRRRHRRRRRRRRRRRKRGRLVFSVRGGYGSRLIIAPRVQRAPIGRFFGIPVGGSAVVAVIDRSGSMNGTTRGRRRNKKVRKITMARQELGRFLASLPPQVRFDVRAFNTHDGAAMGSLVPATPQNVLTAKLWSRTVPAQGGTVIIRSLRRAVASGASTVLLLSDGMPNSGSEPQRILSFVQQAHQRTGVVIHVIGIGMRQNNRLLAGIARITGGGYAIR
jgi:hypothetical protein